MKKIILLLGMMGSVGVAATQMRIAKTTDNVLGPVVAIQREVDDLYNNCLAHMVGETDKPMYLFSCRVDFSLDPEKEFVMNGNQLNKLYEETCTVETNYVRGNMVIYFGNQKAPSTFDEAKLCLQKGTDSFHNKVQLMVFRAP